MCVGVSSETERRILDAIERVIDRLGIRCKYDSGASHLDWWSKFVIMHSASDASIEVHVGRLLAHLADEYDVRFGNFSIELDNDGDTSIRYFVDYA